MKRHPPTFRQTPAPYETLYHRVSDQLDNFKVRVRGAIAILKSYPSWEKQDIGRAVHLLELAQQGILPVSEKEMGMDELSPRGDADK